MIEADEQQNETPPPAGRKTTRRKRGTGFPVVSLAEASRILKEAGKYGFEHPTPAFASYMGHSSTNSGAFRQRLSAFRDWELITGRGELLILTSVAQMIAVPTDPASERRALQEAFVNCDVFSRLHDQTAKGQALDPERLGGRAIHEFGVAPASAAKFVESFIESAIAADLAEEDDDGQVKLWDASRNGRDGRDETGDGIHDDATVPPRRKVRREREGQDAPGPTVRQAWPIAGGEILFELFTDEALPASSFAQIGEVVARLEELAASLTPDDHGELENELEP